MDRDIADFSVNYLTKKGASYAEARLEHHEGSGFILKNGNPEIAGFDKISGLGVRFLINNSLGAIKVKLDILFRQKYVGLPQVNIPQRHKL